MDAVKASKQSASVADALQVMRNYPSAVSFFWQVSRDVQRLRAVDRDIAAGVDSMPQHAGGAHGSGISKPTESRALFLMVDGARWLQALEDERNALIYEIGCGLVICQHVRDELGEKYGNLLECKYIDGMKWRDAADVYGFSASHAKRLGGIALDWLDSVGGGSNARAID